MTPPCLKAANVEQRGSDCALEFLQSRAGDVASNHTPPHTHLMEQNTTQLHRPSAPLTPAAVWTRGGAARVCCGPTAHSQSRAGCAPCTSRAPSSWQSRGAAWCARCCRAPWPRSPRVRSHPCQGAQYTDRHFTHDDPHKTHAQDRMCKDVHRRWGQTGTRADTAEMTFTRPAVHNMDTDSMEYACRTVQAT